MTPGHAIEHLAAVLYEHGMDPLKVAEAVLSVVLEDHMAVCCEHHTRIIARRLTAAVLELGWTMPGQDRRTEPVARQRRLDPDERRAEVARLTQLCWLRTDIARRVGWSVRTVQRDIARWRREHAQDEADTP